ncbi:KRAB-A domain-containing protein 2-like [Gigantopelta aegis]|uniref:KRAB-A domain-containing protein 2-like n=1 Tax=Gigantopelta aegis TaxID=1735272 RepID=UPI001B88B427|nr:KRAB-A domain-containing protein 2-like [Gigantopelta aegis]
MDEVIDVRFKELLLAKKASDAKSVLMLKEEYFQFIFELKEACSAKLKTGRQYYILSRYEIFQCGDVEKLICKRAKLTEEPIYFVNLDAMYGIIKRAHISTGHGGRDKVVKFLSRYANITRESIELFKSLCIECQKKHATTKGVVVRLILSKDFGSRGQVDLIDMQSMTKAPHKWIMVAGSLS